VELELVDRQNQAFGREDGDPMAKRGGLHGKFTGLVVSEKFALPIFLCLLEKWKTRSKPLAQNGIWHRHGTRGDKQISRNSASETEKLVPFETGL
jgi:hypothetical protein